MEFLGKGKSASQRPDLDSGLYQALAAGDLPGAWLLAKPCLERTDFEGLSASTAFNCGLCLYRLEEYEKPWPACGGRNRHSALLPIWTSGKRSCSFGQ